MKPMSESPMSESPMSESKRARQLLKKFALHHEKKPFKACLFSM